MQTKPTSTVEAEGLESLKPVKPVLLIELVKTGLPKLHICVTIAGKEYHVYLCNFRRYDWRWSTDPAGEQGYCDGVDVCNGGGFEYASGNLREFYAVTLAVAFDRCLSTLQEMLRTVTPHPDVIPWERFTTTEKANASLVLEAFGAMHGLCRPALDWLLEDAVAHASPYFERVAVGNYRDGRAAFIPTTTIRGFEPEDCWTRGQHPLTVEA